MTEEEKAIKALDSVSFTCDEWAEILRAVKPVVGNETRLTAMDFARFALFIAETRDREAKRWSGEIVANATRN